jgi:hypothetical protein
MSPDDPNQDRIAPSCAKRRRAAEEEIHKLLEWVRGTGFVTSFLYFFKPPFPSDGGCAAASAGRSGPLAPLGAWPAGVVRGLQSTPSNSETRPCSLLSGWSTPRDLACTSVSCWISKLSDPKAARSSPVRPLQRGSFDP